MDQQDRHSGAAGSPAGNEFHIDGNVGAIATGQYGQATGNVYTQGAGDPLEMIDQLLRKLAADAGMLEDEQAEDVLDDVQRLHTEVHSRRPSAESIRLMLSRLTKATSSTAALLATVEQIRELVLAILH
jgi:methylthioribose-1-phosphate isomerase